jgi:hypothetical protein
MARPSKIDRNLLDNLIRSRGPVSATELAGLLRLNRTTVVRALADHGEDLVTFGATRSTRYAMRRPVRLLGNRWSLFRIDETGRTQEWAHLEAFHERSWRIDWAGTEPEWATHFTEKNHLWSGFPFFLSDIRPQGFLGRLMAARLAPMLRLPDDIRRWSDEDILVYLDASGADLPGNVVLGENSIKQALAAQAQPNPISPDEAEQTYVIIAKDIANQPPGSSAGGEQPKFTATLRQANGELRSVIVKFTAPTELETGRRWADLLICEFHAHEVLAEAGFSNPGARLLESGGRTFLEIPRFDRIGNGGRRGVVSLEALASASVGLHNDWSGSALELKHIGLIDNQALTAIRLLQSFGALIGNTDMHSGNFAFLLRDTLPLQPAPAYDMLPMLWAPGPQGEMPERVFSPARPLPSMAESWSQAVPLAAEFWQRVANDKRVSPKFVEIASRAQEAVMRIV